MTIDAGNLTDLIRECAIDLWQRGLTDPGHFVRAFNLRFGDEISPEQKQYGFDQWVAKAGQKMMKRVDKELRARGELQLELPMDLQKYDIPATLTGSRRGWVPLWDADEEDLEDQLTEMQSHADDCLNKIVGFTVFVERVRPILRANPGWKTGDAIRWLKSQERSAA